MGENPLPLNEHFSHHHRWHQNMSKERIYISNPFQRAVDFMFVMFIIATLLSIAATSYTRPRKTAKLCQVLGATFVKMKLDMMLSHALHGNWPANDQAAMVDGWADEYYSENFSSEIISDATIENGAIHFQLQLDSGQDIKTLTIRPAVPAKDPLGPVVWICGKPSSPSRWSLPGVDRTNVDAKYIPSGWR
jgi:type IV pilus assembly protein PilA